MSYVSTDLIARFDEIKSLAITLIQAKSITLLTIDSLIIVKELNFMKL